MPPGPTFLPWFLNLRAAVAAMTFAIKSSAPTSPRLHLPEVPRSDFDFEFEFEFDFDSRVVEVPVVDVELLVSSVSLCRRTNLDSSWPAELLLLGCVAMIASMSTESLLSDRLWRCTASSFDMRLLPFPNP